MRLNPEIEKKKGVKLRALKRKVKKDTNIPVRYLKYVEKHNGNLLPLRADITKTYAIFSWIKKPKNEPEFFKVRFDLVTEGEIEVFIYGIDNNNTGYFHLTSCSNSNCLELVMVYRSGGTKYCSRTCAWETKNYKSLEELVSFIQSQYAKGGLLGLTYSVVNMLGYGSLYVRGITRYESWSKACSIVLGLPLDECELVLKGNRTAIQERIYYAILNKKLGNIYSVKYQYRPKYLNGTLMSIDIYLESKVGTNIAIEIDGEQHEIPSEAYRGRYSQKLTRKRDKKKNRLISLSEDSFIRHKIKSKFTLKSLLKEINNLIANLSLEQNDKKNLIKISKITDIDIIEAISSLKDVFSMPSKEELESMYSKHGYAGCAKYYEKNEATIYNWLHRYNIPTKGSNKKVICLTDLKVYNSITDACRYYGISSYLSTKLQNSKIAVVKGLSFSYYQDNLDYSKVPRIDCSSRPWKCSPVRNLTTGVVYKSINEATATLKLGRTALSGCLRGRSKTCGGYKWEYVND